MASGAPWQRAGTEWWYARDYATAVLLMLYSRCSSPPIFFDFRPMPDARPLRDICP